MYMYERNTPTTGFTLVELMIAVSVGSFLFLAISIAYSTIKATTTQTKQLENAQEVLRYTSQVFSRSIKQTLTDPTVSGDFLTLSVEQEADTVSCIGTQPASAYTETYTLVNDRLQCDIGAGAQDLLTGVLALNFSYDNASKTVSITVMPEGLPLNYGNGVLIDIAASTVWLNEYYGG